MTTEDQSLEDSLTYGGDYRVWLQGYHAHQLECQQCSMTVVSTCQRGKQILAGYFKRLENQLVQKGYEQKK